MDTTNEPDTKRQRTEDIPHNGGDKILYMLDELARTGQGKYKEFFDIISNHEEYRNWVRENFLTEAVRNIIDKGKTQDLSSLHSIGGNTDSTDVGWYMNIITADDDPHTTSRTSANPWTCMSVLNTGTEGRRNGARVSITRSGKSQDEDLTLSCLVRPTPSFQPTKIRS